MFPGLSPLALSWQAKATMPATGDASQALRQPQGRSAQQLTVFRVRRQPASVRMQRRDSAKERSRTPQVEASSHRFRGPSGEWLARTDTQNMWTLTAMLPRYNNMNCGAESDWSPFGRRLPRGGRPRDVCLRSDCGQPNWLCCKPALDPEQTTCRQTGSPETRRADRGDRECLWAAAL